MPTALTGKVADSAQVSGNMILREQFRPLVKGKDRLFNFSQTAAPRECYAFCVCNMFGGI